MTEHFQTRLADLCVAELRAACRLNQLPESFDAQQMRDDLTAHYRAITDGILTDK